MKVAIIGASGIGKQHAKWFSYEGCDVIAFVGTSENSVSNLENALRNMFNFSGKGYTDTKKMLDVEKPDIIAICTPSELHYEHVMLVLDHGANVYCEKPFVWNIGLDADVILRKAKEILNKSKKKNLLVGMNAQYVAAVSCYNEIRKKFLDNFDKPSSFYFEMESKWNGKEINYYDLLFDVLPHPISLLLEFFSYDMLLKESLIFNISSLESILQFDFKDSSGKICSAKIVCRKINEGIPIRRFGVNDFIVNYSGYNDDQGVYGACFNYKGSEFKYEDLMRVSIRRFMQSVKNKDPSLILVSGEKAYKNLEIQTALYKNILK